MAKSKKNKKDRNAWPDEFEVAVDAKPEPESEPASARSPTSPTSTSLPVRRPSSVSKPPTKSNSKQKTQANIEKLAAAIENDDVSITAQPMPPTGPIPLLICSIGNPGSQYANTFHSAGHTVVNRLATYLRYPPFEKEKKYGNGLLSKGDGEDDWTLWQSTSYMNESGKGVRGAYMAWSKTLPVGEEGKLVIVHDELEKPLGSVSVKTKQGLSARGHNGLKSILASLSGTPFVRIGVGIGRPVSRESNDVAKYVLRKMTQGDQVAVERGLPELVEQLRALSKW